MNKLEIAIINNVLYNYNKKHKKLPSYGRCLVANNIIHQGDMLDYMLELKDGNIYVKYNYYENANEENKYIVSSFILSKE